MSYIQDSMQSFTITLTALLQGTGIIELILVQNLTSGITYTWYAPNWESPPGPPEAIEGDNIAIYPTVYNRGATADTLFGRFVSADITPGQALIQEALVDVGSSAYFTWSFYMPPKNVNITINAGHVE